MLYSVLVETYAKLEKTNSRLTMISILEDLFRRCSTEELEKIVYLTQGKLHPDWTGEPEIGMAEKMVIDTISKATGIIKKEVETLLVETGDIGLVAEIALENKKVKRLMKKELSISDVYNG